MVKTILLTTLCITATISLSAMNNNGKPAPMTQEALRHNLWQEVKKTPEYIRCMELLRQNRQGSMQYKIAFEQLYQTHAYKKYPINNILSEVND